MTTQASIPLKWYVPFAQNDSARVELPVTTSDPTRASQALGFPPLTMQPPESGGVPPQGEDFNGGMNQVARICWWILNGGGWPYDSTFATNSNINGYPNGAKLQSADLLGDWINTTDNNQANPDTNGANWVPGFQYGTTTLNSITGGTITLTPAQAAKNTIVLNGTLSGTLAIILPTWLRDWTIINNTTGAFVGVVKTAAGSGVTLVQNGSPQRVTGDGTNIVQYSQNIAPATSGTQATPMSQAAGIVGSMRNAKMSVTAASASATWTADEVVLETALGGVRYCVPSASVTVNLATVGAGGMDIGTAPLSGYVALYGVYNPTAGTFSAIAVNATGGVAPSIYAGGHLPAGYTASGLLTVWPTNASGQFVIGQAADRDVYIVPAGVLNSSAIVAAYTSLSITGAVPPNAKKIFGTLSAVCSPNTGTSASLQIASTSGGVGGVQTNFTYSGGSPYTLPLITAQTLYYGTSNSAGTTTFAISVAGYTI